MRLWAFIFAMAVMARDKGNKIVNKFLIYSERTFRKM